MPKTTKPKNNDELLTAIVDALAAAWKLAKQLQKIRKEKQWQKIKKVKGAIVKSASSAKKSLPNSGTTHGRLKKKDNAAITAIPPKSLSQD